MIAQPLEPGSLTATRFPTTECPHGVFGRVAIPLRFGCAASGGMLDWAESERLYNERSARGPSIHGLSFIPWSCMGRAYLPVGAMV